MAVALHPDSLYVTGVFIWGCLHHGAHTLQRELYVWLTRLEKVELLLPELQPFRRMRH